MFSRCHRIKNENIWKVNSGVLGEYQWNQFSDGPIHLYPPPCAHLHSSIPIPLPTHLSESCLQGDCLTLMGSFWFCPASTSLPSLACSEDLMILFLSQKHYPHHFLLLAAFWGVGDGGGCFTYEAMQQFLGQGSNLLHSCHLSHSSDNARSSTCCPAETSSAGWG